MKYLSIYSLLFTMIIEPCVFAADAGLGFELSAPAYAEKEFTLEELSQAAAALEAYNQPATENEVLGGRIINSENGAEIFAECVSKTLEGECEKVQYMHKLGFMKKAITQEVLMKDVLAFYTAIRRDLVNNVETEIENRSKGKAESPEFFPATKAQYGGNGESSGYIVRSQSDVYLSNFGIAATAITSIAFVTAFVALVASPAAPLVAIVAGAIFTIGWGAGPIADLAVLPFKFVSKSIKDIRVYIHNRKLARKFRKKLKRIAVALEATAKEGNQVAKLKTEDFDFLVALFEASIPKNTGEVK